jgi:2-keto-4-pentenoate hydratase/2-oxohepta-3-ene-1,7-dioic acid hydratase in catechol pathway
MNDGTPHLGIQSSRGVIDIQRALHMYPDDHVSADPMDVIRRGENGIADLARYLRRLPENGESGFVLKQEDVQWGPCVPAPGKIICVGLNYRKHADETGMPYPEVPVLFSKFNNALNGHLQPIAAPDTTRELDYEAELCIVMGKRAKKVKQEEALQYVFGYCCANDVSARDLQMRTSQWLLGKTGDGFCPVGPYLVTSDEVGNPQNLSIKTTVNGEIRQNSNTADMIFTCAEIISYISNHFTLEPGDLILTGTPEGVAMGMENKPYLRAGDTVTVEIERLGALTNLIV